MVSNCKTTERMSKPIKHNFTELDVVETLVGLKQRVMLERGRFAREIKRKY
jgi:hypothetical protein